MCILSMILRLLGNDNLLDNDGYDFLFETKNDVMPPGDVYRDIDHPADTDSDSLLNIPQILTELRVTGHQRSDIQETLPVPGDR